jgi:multiple sugar transport system substrate-binding protein
MGLAITPSPNTLNTQGKTGYFTSGLVATMVDGRWAVPVYRKEKNLNWDCAPLPVSPSGIEAGHSGSVGFVIPQKSRTKDAAFKLIEFLAGPEGQSAQAASGFNIPNQMDLAATDAFLQPGSKPQNAEIFLKAAAVQRAGDWTYLPDNLWIDQWANYLNDEVRNGDDDLTGFFNTVTARTNEALTKYGAQ